MILVDRLEDPRLPTLVVHELWEYLRDDSPQNPEDFVPRMDEDSRWYVSVEDNDVVGVYWARRLNHVTWEIHTNVRKEYWGSGKTVPHAKKALEFIFADTGALKMNAIIPESAPHVIEYAEKVGFTKEGRSKDSFLKDGKLYDQIYLGIGK